MNQQLFEEKKPEIVATLEEWLRDNRILDKGEQLEVKLSIIRTPRVRVTFDESDTIDRMMAMPIKVFLDRSEFSEGYRSRAESIMYYIDQFHFVGQLARRPGREVLKVRNVGHKTLRELKAALMKVGLDFGFSFPPGPLEIAALRSLKTSQPFSHMDAITTYFDTFGDVADASRARLEEVFRSKPYFDLSFDCALREVSNILDRFHLTGAFQNK